jgi:hypothetical protein
MCTEVTGVKKLRLEIISEREREREEDIIDDGDN